MIESNKPSEFAMKAAEIISGRPKISYDAICDAADQSFKPLRDSHEKLITAAKNHRRARNDASGNALDEALTAAQAVAKRMVG